MARNLSEMRRICWSLGVCLVVAGCVDRLPDVGVVLDRKISADAFRERYQGYLAVSQQRDNLVLRQQILNNMINEELIINDIRRLGLDSDRVARQRLQAIRHQALLDEYARSVSTDTLEASEEELRREFKSFNTRVTARYLYAKSREDAARLKERVLNGETFEDLAREVFQDPGLASNGGSLGTFGWGEMETELEHTAFTIPVAGVSDPIKLKVGYAIVRVDGRVVQPLASQHDYAKVRGRLERAVIERKTVQLVQEAARTIHEGLRIRFNDDVLPLVVERWTVLSEQADPEMGGERSDDIPRSTIAWVNGSPWTVAEFLERAEFTSERQKRRVTSEEELREFIAGLATRSEILRRAENQELDTKDLVKHQIDNLSRQFLLERWSGVVQDSVGAGGWSDAEVEARYHERRHEFAFPPTVNVAEILVRTSDEANETRRLLTNGADFGKLAQRRSIRLWAAKKGGELGYGTRADFGVLGEKFFSARAGRILGPEFVDPYFAVFKILAHRPGRQKTLSESRRQIEDELSTIRKREVLRQAVESLRVPGSFSIDVTALANVPLHTSN